MYKTFKFRIYPNDNQIVLINKTFDCYRFIYNYFLSICKDNGFSSAFAFFLKEVGIQSLKVNIINKHIGLIILPVNIKVRNILI